MNNKKMSIIVILSFIMMIIVNIGVNIIPLNGVTTGEISMRYNTLFAPSGFTFWIWGLIYFLLGSYCYYQYNFYIRYRRSTDRVMKRVNQYFLVSNLLNSAWIICWHYELLPMTVIIMVFLLLILIRIRQTIARRSTLNSRERMYLLVPFSVYFSWITIATIANVSSLLVYLKWNTKNLSKETVTVGVVIIGFLIGYMTMIYFLDVVYGLVFLWSFIGILVRQVTVFNSIYSLLIITISVGIVLILLAIIQVVMVRAKSRYHRKSR